MGKQLGPEGRDIHLSFLQTAFGKEFPILCENENRLDKTNNSFPLNLFLKDLPDPLLNSLKFFKSLEMVSIDSEDYDYKIAILKFLPTLKLKALRITPSHICGDTEEYAESIKDEELIQT